ncbi:MAG: hypothetical protein HYV53_00910 [Parcubacteria group bacterium]|nr:hypothetical protein [Parcubacteria group bacterium]
MERLKAWAGIVGVFLGLPLLLWIFVVKAPFMAVFTWVVFFIGIPMLWKKFSKGDAVEFWENIVKNGIKIGVSLALFLLVRAYFTLLIGFAPFESWVNWSTSTDATTLLGYTPTKILFEVVFLSVVGYLLVIKAVYEKTTAPKIILTSFLVFCFLLQTFVFGAGVKATQIAKAPLKEEAMANAVEKDGLVGGMAIQLKTTLFGKGEPTPRNINWMTTKIGLEKIDLFRVYTGDVIYYYSAEGFWAEYGDGNKYFNNPSYNGQMMRFTITSAKEEGEIVKVWGDKPSQLKYKVENRE